MVEMMRIRKMSKFDVEIVNEAPEDNASYENIPVVARQSSTEEEIVKIHPNGPQEENKQEGGLLISDDSGYDYEQG